MSNLLLSLLASTSGTTPPVDPPDPPNLWPVAAENTDVAAMRPSVARAYTVGSTGTYSTIQSAINAAAALPGTDRTLIVVQPGTYAECIAPTARTPVISTTGNSADVVLADSTDALLGVLDSTGGTYVEGITFRRTGTNAGNPKYPQHHSATAGTVSAYVNCRFEALDATAPGAPSGIGMDGYPGSLSIWYGCDLTQSVVGQATNLHGWASNTSPLRVALVNCTGDGKGEATYNSLSTLADEVWVVGCSGFTSIRALGSATILHTDWTGSIDAANVDGDTDWPTS